MTALRPCTHTFSIGSCFRKRPSSRRFCVLAGQSTGATPIATGYGRHPCCCSAIRADLPPRSCKEMATPPEYVFHVEMLPAAHGDSILLTYGRPPDLHAVLIDG